MKKIKLITLFILLAQTTYSQNLVPNPSFEEYIYCPDMPSNLCWHPNCSIIPPACKHWFDPTGGTSDYYNACSTLPEYTGVPQNMIGYQFPHDGNAYAGFAGTGIPYATISEYIGVKLIEALKTNQQYCFSFWLSLADSSCSSNNKIGAYFTTDTTSYWGTSLINVIPQIQINQIITDTTNWTLIENEFIASGGENFLTIGLFNPTDIDSIHIQHCHSLVIFQDESYYYLDDVSLIEGACNEVPEVIISNILTPNGDGINDIWKVDLPTYGKAYIYNRWGSLIYKQEGKNIVWSPGNIGAGIYYYIIYLNKADCNIETKKGLLQIIN